jgi:hypothetical protein
VKKDKPNCYKCKWRGVVPGSAHSSCRHPKCKSIEENPMLNIMSILGGVRGGLPPLPTGLKVKGNEQGIRNGWFNHPLNFDPVWLESCNGFEPKEG